VSRSCGQISSSATSIFIFLPIEKLVEFVAHLSGEDQQGTLPALIQHTLRMSLEKLVERGGRKFRFGGFQNATMPDLSSRKIPEYPSTKIKNCTR
jgi:hypothetical protein